MLVQYEFQTNLTNEMGHHLVWYLQFRFRTLPNPCRALPFLFPPVQVPKFILLCLDNYPYRCSFLLQSDIPCFDETIGTLLNVVLPGCMLVYIHPPKNATVHISIFVWLTRVEIGWRPWFPDWKLRFLFGWQFGVLHFQKSSSISHSLVGGLEHEFYFSIYWEEYSQLTNIFSEG